MTQSPRAVTRILFRGVSGLALTGAIWAAGWTGLAIEHGAGIGVIPLWLPSGVALGGVFLLGKRALPFVWLGSFLVSGAVRPSLTAAVFATGDLSSAWLGWYLLNHMRDFDREFRRARDVQWFVLYGAVLSTLSGATVGVASQAFGGILPWRAVPGTFLTWWLGDVTGVLVSAPLLMRWRTFQWIQLRKGGRLREAGLAYGLIGVLIALLALPTGGWGLLDDLWKVLSWPLLLWTALRFGAFGAPSAVFLLTVGNIEEFLRSVHGNSGGSQHALWDQWAATMALSIAGLVVMALEAARTRADEEREKLQIQLAQAQKMESVGRLAGGIAHDFNNLLTVINGHSKLMLGKMGVDNPVHRPVTQILKAGERAAGLTRQLLAFSRRQVIEARVIDLNSVVKGMQSIVEHLMGDDVPVVLDLHPDTLPVLSDVHQMEQVIMNLAVNARDAMPEGGCLQISTAPAKQDRPGAWCVLAVSDTGAGMDEATRQKMFDPFFTTKPTGTSTGLGLSIVQGIIAQTNGYIEVDTKPACGTTFRICLPLESWEKISEERTAHARVRQGSETILVVEDWPDVRQYVTDVLRGHGYDVTTAADAEEALQLCARRSSGFDLVLADVMMAGMSGIDLVSRLTTGRHAAKGLLMSGFAEQGKTHTSMPRGAYFLPKPFSPEQLVARVQAIL